MDKNEIIFFAVVIAAYLICTLTLDVPDFVHLMFAILLLAVLIITVPLKYKQQLENEKISKILNILSMLLLISYIITTISELWFKKILFINSGIFLVLFLIVLIVGWFFKKNNN